MQHCLTVLIVLGALQSASAAAPAKPTGGYVVGNFGIAAQVNEADGPHAWIKVNPPKLGVWLQNFAQGELWIREAGGAARRLHLRALQVSRLYPEYHATFDAGGRLQVDVTMFAPLGLEAKTGFPPGLIIDTVLKTDRPWSGTLGYTLTQARVEPNSDDDPTPWPAAMQRLQASNMAGGLRGRAFLVMAGVPVAAVNATTEADRLTVSASVKVEPGVAKTVTFVAGAFDTNGFYTRTAPTAEALAADLTSRAGLLHDQLHAFEAALPRTGDAQIDEYLNWYASAGILLTKGDRDGHIVTMGYRELNPRDSFWTSGIHLVFWRDLERAMLLETVHGQAPTGRIPSTLLPLIDRGDEIDSAEYFILRAARYYRWYRDEALRAQVWPAMQKAIDYLVSRDSEHVGVPMQLSFWADWKDVKGEEGRRYAPHFALLWLASLRAGSEWALLAKDSAVAARYEALAKRASAFINRLYDQGGLWNGHNYVDRWSDGRRPSYLLQDQVVGAYFNVIPAERLNLLYQQLRANETPWGVREKFPYQPDWTEDMGGMPGNYHNGGIWPYLNFVDATGRYLHGHAADAERIILEIGKADLDAQGDNKPGEYLNGDTGANRGFPIQSWDAAMFSAIYFGAFGLERTSASSIDIHVHIPPPRDFSTELVLPACTGTLSRQAGKLSWREDQDACRKQGITVKMSGES